MTSQLLDDLLTSIEANESVALVTVVKATGSYVQTLGKKILVWLDKEPVGELAVGPIGSRILEVTRQSLSTRRCQLYKFQENDGMLEIFVEVQRRSPTLLIVGAGHVALPLAELGKMIDFEVIVLDDRPKYANEERFPMADQVLAQPFQETLRTWPIDNDTYIVLVTRGHSHDVECLLEVLYSPARYIGMIGSKRRIRGVFEMLEQEQDIDPTKFARVYAPIGLDIGAENPAEIAVSIVAEIVNIYRGGRSVSLSDALLANSRLPLHPARSTS